MLGSRGQDERAKQDESYRQLKNDHRLEFTPQVSSDRTTWTSDPATVQKTQTTPIDTEFDQVEYQDLTPVTPGTLRFIRLKVMKHDN